MKRKDLSEEKARKLIREVDKDRGSYYKYYTDQVWGEVNNYDLCIDSGKIGVPGTVEVLKTYLNSLSQN
jgi:cytidylate kinase